MQLFSFLHDDEGGVLAEYGILIAVLVLGLVAVMVTLRTQFTAWFGTIGPRLQAVS